MTGFASKTASLHFAEAGDVTLAVELKSINSRFFEVVSKLPSMLSSLEVKIIQQLQHKLLRGRVYLTVRFVEDGDNVGSAVLSGKAVEDYLGIAKTIKEKYNVAGELTLHDLLSLPNVFVTTRQELTKETEAVVLDFIDKIADGLLKTRQEEGAQLEKDLRKRFAICGDQMTKIQKEAYVCMDRLKKDIETKREHEEGDELAKLQLVDAYVLLNKIDVHEEITRFESHLKSVETLLESTQTDKGKRLDFILQELLRETNTTMAKCSNFDISSCCVNIKVELEKAREQVQNIV
jgi:uncharacterized protein (TIGR00255 family)